MSAPTEPVVVTIRPEGVAFAAYHGAQVQPTTEGLEFPQGGVVLLDVGLGALPRAPGAVHLGLVLELADVDRMNGLEGLEGWVSGLASAGAVAELVAAVAGRPPAVPHFQAGWRALEPAEREVLLLVAAGKTTREIAAALDKSARTVERQSADAQAKVGGFLPRTIRELVRREILTDVEVDVGDFLRRWAMVTATQQEVMLQLLERPQAEVAVLRGRSRRTIGTQRHGALKRLGTGIEGYRFVHFALEAAVAEAEGHHAFRIA
jgi:DNA-binding CsgD family transcriptional regulator